jgi:hypothetical protein
MIEDVEDSVKVDYNAEMPAVSNECQDNDNSANTNNDNGDRDQG